EVRCDHWRLRRAAVIDHQDRQIARVAFSAIGPEMFAGMFWIKVTSRRHPCGLLALVLGRSPIALLMHMDAMLAGWQSVEARYDLQAAVGVLELKQADHGTHSFVVDLV